MNDLVVKNVDLFGDTVIAARDEEGNIWAGVKWMCEGFGLSDDQIKNERKKIGKDLALSKGGSNLTLPTKGGKQEVLCLRNDFVPLWIAKITVTPSMKENNPGLVDKLVKYQLQAKDVLADAFLPKKKEKQTVPKNPSLSAVTSAAKFLTALTEKAGCDGKIQLLTAKSFYEANGYPVQIDIQADKHYVDTTHIARHVGLYYQSSGKPADKAVNEIIRRLQLPESMYTETWESKGNWQGAVRKYDEAVIDQVRNWYCENGYPRDIEYTQVDGQRKSYHVIFREAEVA